MSVPTPTLSPNPWLRVLDALEKKINRHSYDTWLKPTRYSHSSNGIMYVRVPTSDFRHVQDKYADLIQEALDSLNMDYQDVQFVTPEDDPAATPVRHDGGLSAPTPGTSSVASAPSFSSSQARFDWD
jgi:chromosomal replication initiator protein